VYTDRVPRAPVTKLVNNVSGVLIFGSELCDFRIQTHLCPLPSIKQYFLLNSCSINIRIYLLSVFVYSFETMESCCETEHDGHALQSFYALVTQLL
jgi:hypothetical protein